MYDMYSCMCPWCVIYTYVDVVCWRLLSGVDQVISARLTDQPKKGHGALRAMGRCFCGVHTSEAGERGRRAGRERGEEGRAVRYVQWTAIS